MSFFFSMRFCWCSVYSCTLSKPVSYMTHWISFTSLIGTERSKKKLVGD